ncbi:unnamed protein product [Closterium sp. Yama58-4]|nr:unnamed protein product [Closterium sp. Yama58-4]
MDATKEVPIAGNEGDIAAAAAAADIDLNLEDFVDMEINGSEAELDADAENEDGAGSDEGVSNETEDIAARQVGGGETGHEAEGIELEETGQQEREDVAAGEARKGVDRETATVTAEEAQGVPLHTTRAEEEPGEETVRGAEAAAGQMAKEATVG